MKKILFLFAGLMISNYVVSMEAPEESRDQQIVEEKLLGLDPELQSMIYEQALKQRLKQAIEGKTQEILNSNQPIYFYMSSHVEPQAYQEYQEQRDKNQQRIDEIIKLIGFKRQGNFLLHSDQRQRYLTKLAKAVFLSTGESLPLSTLQLFQNVFGINAKEAETLSEEIVTFNTSIEEIFAYGIFRKVVGNPMKFGKTNWNVERLNLSQLHLNNIAGLATTGIKNKRVISIDLSGNNIKALPGNITHLLAEFPNLKEIDLSSNPIVQTEERRARITQELHKAFPDLTIITE